MKRRLFLKTTLASAAANGLLTTHAGATAGAANEAPQGRVFFDPRFRDAKNLAAKFFSTGAATPVNSDVTALWVSELNGLSRLAPLSLKGVTTESFYFCLKTLLESRGAVDARIERAGRDIYVWSIRSAPKYQAR